MITIYKDQIATLDVVIYRGSSRCLENFNRAKVEAFLYGMNSRVLMTHELGSDGVLHCDVPAGLSEGVYALEVVWIKNDLSRHNPSLGSRSVMRARKDELFAVTEFNNEVYPVPGSGTLAIRVEMQAGSYGYDGLDAYELAVMRGKTLLSEEEWLSVRGGGAEPDQESITYNKDGRLAVKVGREDDGTYVLQVGEHKFELTEYGQVVSKGKAYFGSSEGVPTGVNTTTFIDLSLGSHTVSVETGSADKKKCHWCAVATTSGYVCTKAVDVDGDDITDMVKTVQIGEYTMFYYLSAAYISNKTVFTLTK